MKRQLLFIALLGLSNQILPHGYGHHHHHGGPSFGFYVGTPDYPYGYYPYYRSPFGAFADAAAGIATAEAIKSASNSNRDNYASENRARREEIKRQIRVAEADLDDLNEELKDLRRRNASDSEIKRHHDKIDKQETLLERLNKDLRNI